MRKSIIISLALLLSSFCAARAEELFPPPVGFPNLVWTIPDSVTACPAGDTVIAGHPARVRIAIHYYGHTDRDDPPPRVGVPPESIYVAIGTYGGNAAANDERVVSGFGNTVMAEDSTDAAGFARITLPSVSGAGALVLNLWVSGKSIGTKTVTLRSTDTNADGVTNAADEINPADLNYNGSTYPTDTADLSIVQGHSLHSHRNALHGTPVRLTSLCGTCDEGSANTIGDSEMSWSPDGKRLAFSVFVDNGLGSASCSIYLVPSDPTLGSTLTRFTTPPADQHDYDPSWSPLGTTIVWDRHDNTLYRRGIPGIAAPADTVPSIIIERHYTTGDRGAAIPAYSPDGTWLAFSLKDPSGPFHIWKIPVSGDSTQMVQLTNTADVVDFFPQWSPDGNWVVFDRAIGGSHHQAYRVKANGDSLQAVLTPSTPVHASTPAVSPDGTTIIAGKGESSFTPVTVIAGQDSAQAGILSYPEFASGGDAAYVLSPRWSPDGTRLAIRAQPPGHPTELNQLWAARQNMSRPPIISTLGGTAVLDSVPYIDRTIYAGDPYTIAVAAADPDGDPLTYRCDFLRGDLGMSFNASTHAFHWTPPTGSIGYRYTVKFRVTTPSGGTDYALARLTIASLEDCGDCPPILEGAASSQGNGGVAIAVRGGVFFLNVTLGMGQNDLSLSVYDVRGRRVKSIATGHPGPGHYSFRWHLDSDHGMRVGPSVYFAVLEAAGKQRVKRLIVLP